VIFPGFIIAIFAPRNVFTNGLGAAAGMLMAFLGISGAILAIRLLFLKFHFACPKCRGRETDFGMSERKEMWLYCPQCGLFKESGFLKLKLDHEGPDDGTGTGGDS
ncbi:MAG: hypothetical protein ACAI34_06170, partial [Verrucomicrobium sp.]